MTPKHSAHLAALLEAGREFVRSYMVLSPPQADAIALWVGHTYTLDAFETTPFLAVTSPTKQCGKSRLFDVLELLVARPWKVIMPSEAVLYRKIDHVSPTLLLDETDAIFNGKNPNTEPLRALLNAGNRRGTTVPRCVGPSQQLVDFKVFCAKALAGIGELPDTIADRAIPVRLARKRADERAEKFRFREALELAEPIAQAFASWAQDAVSWLEDARPAIPAGLDDRAEDAWEPLFAIAELAGGDWPERARAAAVTLSGGRDDEAFGTRLLADIRAVFSDAGTDRLSSAALAAALCELEESPWGDWRGKQLNANALARQLKKFDVRPRTVRFDDETTAKGYHLEQFEDVFARYLGPSDNPPVPVPADSGRHNVTTRTDTAVATHEEPSQADDGTSRKPAWAAGCDGVTDEMPPNRDSDLPEDLEELAGRYRTMLDETGLQGLA